MCGIAGRWGAGTPEGASEVVTMLARLAHRGPDGAGLVTGADGSLGHHRLAIHDLTAAGRQPMEEPGGDLAIAVNGTFHEARALRERYAARGYRFQSRSDSELLIPMYREHGVGVVEHLRGPFAFAIADRRRRRLILARDRLGQKPLFVARDEQGLTFASELGALMAVLGRRSLDESAAAAFLQAGYVPNTGSLIAEARALPPATVLVADEGGIREERYWSPPTEADPACTPDAAARALGEALDEAVLLRTRSERPLGVLLSGGLDSAAILLAAQGHLPTAPPSFTLGFDRRRYDERGAARGTARHLGSPHQAFAFTSDIPSLLRDLVATTGEASADSSWLALAELCRQLPPEVRVVLAGDGGDEILLGYRRHALVAFAAELSPARRQGLARLAPLAPGWRRRQGLTALAESPLGALADLAGLVSRRRWRDLIRPELQGPADPLTASYPESPAGAEPAGLAGLADLCGYLPGDLLPKTDRASMRYGVEIWSPFLDHRVVETALAIPAALRLQGLRGKQPLRRLLRGRVPGAVLSRPKRGFGVPLATWLQTGSYARFAREILGDRRELFGRILRSGDALPLLDAVQRGDAALAAFVHGCVVLALFEDCFLG